MNTARLPKVCASVNGTAVEAILQVDILMGGSGRSAQFELTASTRGSRIDMWWISARGRTPVKISIYDQQLEADVMSFQGLADDITFDPINETARVRGRDFSSLLINSTYQASFSNQTSSEIANSIAARHGFISNIFPTTDLVGSFRNNGYSQILLNAHSPIINEWALLNKLAKEEGFEFLIDGLTLIFAPANSLPRKYLPIGRGDIQQIMFDQRCQLSEQTNINVKSWNTWIGQAFVYTGDQAPPQVETSDGLSEDTSTEIAVVVPNLTPAGVDALGQKYLNAVNSQATHAQITMPGELTLKPLDVLSIAVSETTLDTDYIVESVRRHFSASTGFVQYVRASAIVPTINQAAAGI